MATTSVKRQTKNFDVVIGEGKGLVEGPVERPEVELDTDFEATMMNNQTQNYIIWHPPSVFRRSMILGNASLRSTTRLSKPL